MPNTSAPLILSPQTIFSDSSVQNHELGQIAHTSDGRRFRYAQAGASNLVAGNMIQSAAIIANHVNMTPSAAAIGATTVSVTPGATAGAANLYAGGYLIASTGPGNGIAYKIKSHPAITSSTAFVVTLEEGLVVAFTTSSRIDIVANSYKNVIQSPVTTLTGHIVGCAPFAITAVYYGWIQDGGLAPVLIAGTPGVGLAVVCPATAAGAVVVDGAATETPVVGYMAETGVDGKNKLVRLTFA